MGENNARPSRQELALVLEAISHTVAGVPTASSTFSHLRGGADNAVDTELTGIVANVSNGRPPIYLVQELALMITIRPQFLFR